jgi:chorismate dehydratase
MRVKISAVAYLNAAPFTYGLRHYAPLCEGIDLSLDIPAVSAQKLHAGAVDVALMPVAAIPQSSACAVATDFCIGAVGEVASVAVFANAPLEALHTIYLDAHSRTSAALVQLLADEYWRLKLNFKPIEDYAGIENVKDRVGYLLIGDKTFAARPRFTHSYDLAQAWVAHTGLPFVFAAWVVRPHVPSAFVSSLNEALSFGVQHRSEVCEEAQERYPEVDVRRYLTDNISYPLDAPKKAGMALFLQKLKRYAK